MSLPLGLSLKNSLLTHASFHTLLNEIFEIAKTIPKFEELKTDPEFLLLVCRIVECKMGKNKQQIDKKDLVVNIFDKLYNLTDGEKEQIKSSIQFLYDNKKIKKVSFVKLVVLTVAEWVSKKLL